MTVPAPLSGQPVDLSDCAREPIHLPGSIQPHGALLVLRPDTLEVLQASRNAAELLGLPIWPTGATPPGAPAALGDTLRAVLGDWLLAPGAAPLHTVALGQRQFQLSGHLGPQGLLLEFEPALPGELESLDALYPHLRRFVDQLEAEADIAALAQLAACEVRRITGFHRVLVYRFDEDWHGTVIAEDGDGSLPSYLDLRFPASDIPPQARELYRRNRLRLIPDAGYLPVPVEPALSPLDGRPLDLSAAALRSVSPVHLEYMRNMGTAASMSVSILVDGRLWGLVSCHHAGPRQVGPQIRSACDFLAQILALQLAARAQGAEAAERLKLKELEAGLLARVAQAPSVQDGLLDQPDAWLALASAQGAAVLREHGVSRTGRTPDETQLQALAAWLHQQGKPAVFATHELPALYPPAQAWADSGCGVLAVSISALHPHYILWFRPELVHTVRWGGPPDKPAPGEDGRLHPRRSFSMWTEQVRGSSARWSAAQLEVVQSFRNAVVSFVLRRAEERAQLSERLEASNRELEAFSYSISHDLRAPFRHIVGYAQLLGEREAALDTRSRHYLDSIVESALAAGQLVDDLLAFSQLGRSTLSMTAVDMDKLLDEVRRSVRIDQGNRQVEWRTGPLPPAWGDAALLRQALSNLIGNALKYTRPRECAVIEITGEQRDGETVYSVRDNGVGFDMAYAGKLFGVFQRLHRAEDFEGSGIGLALARRILERHGGWISADGRLDQGAVFRFGLPATPHENSADA
ncbi:ATP-binding protein [Eleftheria terrae]|uniref:ATP-binding protein n=1 Tax=Eleftheria terrae TaxID=1597781 RepID=UPI00263B558B|nr:ATP-binding protein [Eleftheria terrae]WKB53510.1 GAF domain-containing protein [Eleftheria terrae]